jgi:hypothetical protein
MPLSVKRNGTILVPHYPQMPPCVTLLVWRKCWCHCLASNRIQQFFIWRDKRLDMRVRNSFERTEQQRFRIFSAIQISDVFKIHLQEDSL